MTTLYRMRSGDGTLLYVGVSGKPARRFEQHARDKAWWSEVTSIDVEHFPSRLDALNAERRAIQGEHPRYNIALGNVSAIDPDVPRTTKAEPRVPDDGWWFFSDDAAEAGQLLRDEAGRLLARFEHPLLNKPTGEVRETADCDTSRWMCYPDYVSWRFALDSVLSSQIRERMEAEA